MEIELLTLPTGEYEIYKEKKSHKTYLVHEAGCIGNVMVTFDKKKIYNLFTDYPDKFTKEEKEIFDKEHPYWARFFGGI